MLAFERFHQNCQAVLAAVSINGLTKYYSHCRFKTSDMPNPTHLWEENKISGLPYSGDRNVLVNGGGHRSTQRKPPHNHKSMVTFSGANRKIQFCRSMSDRILDNLRRPYMCLGHFWQSGVNTLVL